MDVHLSHPFSLPNDSQVALEVEPVEEGLEHKEGLPEDSGGWGVPVGIVVIAVFLG
jgi:hypothetical protein